MPVIITAFYASLLALCYVYLSFSVIRERLKGKVSLGDGGIKNLNRAIRAHSNFAEYVPLCLLLQLTLELNSDYVVLLHSCGVGLLFGRILHAYGLRHHSGTSWQRLWGMLLTFSALLVLCAANLSLIYWGKTI